MPVYEYECGHCGVFEISQSIKDDPISKCPQCNRKVKRLISLNNFVLKGSGWYATDYARKGNGGNGKATEKKPSAEPKADSKCDLSSKNESCNTCPKASEST